jgi:GntR family transcriptional regulator
MEFYDKKPIYMQIADYFCENILLKEWKENEKIPSVREIAVAMEVNPNTAMRAFVELQDLGIIYNKRGIGYFVAEDGGSKALAFKKDEFIKKELPVLFKTLKMLNMNCQELEIIYNQNK